jgi:N-acetyl-alpha-D-glucosaminyl L-malate synthase BshA
MPFAASAYLARQLLKPRPLGVVTTLHGTDITVVGVEPAFFRITQFSIQSSDRLTAVSRFLKERTEATFGTTRPIDVIHNFVDTTVFTPRKRSLLRLGPPEARVLMHASNFRPVKNIPAVIQIFAEVRKRVVSKLVMVGDGPEKAGAEQLVRELGLERDVLFLGNQDCMEELLPLADVFLLPSSSESFGLVALEAMSAEVPVVASNIGGLPEVVDHGATGYLHDPGHTAGFVASSLKLLGNESLRRSMGRRARKVARERFSVRLAAIGKCSEETIGWPSWPKEASLRETPRRRSACCGIGPRTWWRCWIRRAPAAPRPSASGREERFPWWRISSMPRRSARTPC